jgi:hypothetical protein
MLESLKTLLVRHREHETERLSEEYTAMTPGERHELETIRSRGAAGERDVLVEHEAERVEDAEEGRPMAYVDPPEDEPETSPDA